jgi:hypothetical protein
VSDPFGTDNQYFVGIVVDADADVIESDETNNSNRGQTFDRDDVNYATPIANAEGFESGDFSHWTWFRRGNANWLVTNVNPGGGDYSAQSGSIGDNQSSTLSVTHTTGAGTISFKRRVSSEDDFDFLRFYIDGGAAVGSWSGDQNWARSSYPVTAGTHTFTWTYSKDGSVSSGLDAAWIDDITFPLFLGDYNGNRAVDAADYVVWRRTLGTSVVPNSGADGSGDGTIGPEDYDIWRRSFGNTLPPGGAQAANQSVELLAVPTVHGEKARGAAEPRFAEARSVPDVAEVSVARSLPSPGQRTSLLRQFSSSFKPTFDAVFASTARGAFHGIARSALGFGMDELPEWNVESRVSDGLQDTNLLAWLMQRETRFSAKRTAIGDTTVTPEESSELTVQAIDRVFAGLGDDEFAWHAFGRQPVSM